MTEAYLGRLVPVQFSASPMHQYEVYTRVRHDADGPDLIAPASSLMFTPAIAVCLSSAYPYSLKPARNSHVAIGITSTTTVSDKIFMQSLSYEHAHRFVDEPSHLFGDD